MNLAGCSEPSHYRWLIFNGLGDRGVLMNVWKDSNNLTCLSKENFCLSWMLNWSLLCLKASCRKKTVRSLIHLTLKTGFLLAVFYLEMCLHVMLKANINFPLFCLLSVCYAAVNNHCLLDVCSILVFGDSPLLIIDNFSSIWDSNLEGKSCVFCYWPFEKYFTLLYQLCIYGKLFFAIGSFIQDWSFFCQVAALKLSLRPLVRADWLFLSRKHTQLGKMRLL